MAEYKVPQDVEADDKLLGPFSFRQFIYLIVVAVGIGLGWGLYMLFPPLVIIPLSVVVFFGALALPLRKDQPMEIYLAAIMSFYLKPRKRFWTPDGIESLVEITAPRTIEAQRTKNLSQTEAEQRLSYLASLSDTRGWAVRNISQPDTAMNSDLYFEAQQTQDVLDENNTISQNLDYMINQTDARRKQDMINRMKNPQPVQAPQPQAPGPGQYVIPNQQTIQQSVAPLPPWLRNTRSGINRRLNNNNAFNTVTGGFGQQQAAAGVSIAEAEEQKEIKDQQTLLKGQGAEGILDKNGNLQGGWIRAMNDPKASMAKRVAAAGLLAENGSRSQQLAAIHATSQMI